MRKLCASFMPVVANCRLDSTTATNIQLSDIKGPGLKIHFPCTKIVIAASTPVKQHPWPLCKLAGGHDLNPHGRIDAHAVGGGVLREPVRDGRGDEAEILAHSALRVRVGE